MDEYIAKGDNRFHNLSCPNLEIYGLLSSLESELKNIREEKVKGIITRAKVKWSIEGERSTRYFCNLEKRHYTEKSIPKLISEDNPEVTHQKDILVHQQLFYQTLYECRGTIITFIKFSGKTIHTRRLTILHKL
jgi:hypothetical protein